MDPDQTASTGAISTQFVEEAYETLVNDLCCEWLFKDDIMTEKDEMSQCMRFPTMWYVLPANAQTSLRIRAV